uniref:NADH-ubiquinone oxidoreductase chain 6 n=1 Tax=Scarabaeoidea sp. KM-2017 TaxID=2219446 RepID=A0A346RIQ1_9SCAR|nr:NADH dehydrogenase subunit 6 [Scarabaeoidea sp. KM-2017]
MSFMFMMISMIMSIFIVTFKHPLSMGLTLLIQTIMISLSTGFLNKNYWYSYILFLIMVGSMLILFIYMTSIASNEKFQPSIKLLFTFLIMIMIMIMIMIKLDPYFFLLNNNYEIYLNTNNYSSLNKYLNFPNNMISIMLIIYLFITLLAVVKITNFKKGTLRHSN